jgi:uroporphyrinogen decarboxylase
MTRRERVLRGLSFQETDRVPMDLAGMASTGISCFAYPRLVEALGLPPRRPRVYDTMQMLALPDLDVLDALDCDVVTINWDMTNAFDQPEQWHDFDFGGRLPAQVRRPDDYVVQADGTVEQPRAGSRMPPASFVFDSEHGGQPLGPLDDEELPLYNLDALPETLEGYLPTAEAVTRSAELCARVREATDRAVFATGPIGAGISIMAHGGVGIFPVICLLRPDYVADYHELMTEHFLQKAELLLPAIASSVDIVMLSADDWGTQESTIASPRTFRELFLPYYRRMNDAVHRLAPDVRTFLHCCGAVFDIIDDIIEAGFDSLNPVQWTAGGHAHEEWKKRCDGRLALWGGGANTQVTLPHGSLREVESEVAEVVSCLSEGGGYVFNSIHNLLAEVEPEKVIALYRTAAEVAPWRAGHAADAGGSM